MREQTRPKKTARKDWHRADIVAALRKAGWSLRRLAQHHGYANPTTLGTAMSRHWPKGERIIAEAIGCSPAEIWPSRYAEKYSVLAPASNAKAIREEVLCT
ncbi:helix-turn-helix domain-containing protein [Bordetella hinzii]|uniref:helix-turn-helix domain-containing protein n=1 Tax=Bordetella hinzii TaxID=103855 RepID=UPI0009BF7CE9|nr:helix-turn-helix domain-containing protein [Bordetella hinzii]